MRILSISNLFPPGFIGGYELGAFDILRGLAERGHELEVLTSEYFLDYDSDGLPAVRRELECVVPNRSPSEETERHRLGCFALPRNLRMLAARLVQFRPDVVLCFNIAGLGAPALLRLLAASGVKPVVVLMDNPFMYMAEVSVAGERAAFEQVFGVEDWPDVTRFVFLSRNLHDEVKRDLGRELPHTAIVPGWFDPADLPAPPPERDDGITRFVFASRVAAHKGIYIALEACEWLLRHGYPRFTFDVYGAGDVAIMQQRVTALGLQDRVFYKGAPAKADLQAQYRAYDALIFPTWAREPFGFVVAEAAASGCIPIMTAGVGAGEWFLDEVDCMRISRDVPSLCAAMIRLMSLTPASRLAMRSRAQTTALEFFDFRDTLDRLEAILREAASPPGRDPRLAEAALNILTETWRSAHG